MIVSTDSHVIEPPDLWITRLPRSLHDRAPRLVADDDADWWYVDGLKLMSVHGGADVGVRFEDQAKLRMAARMSEVRRGGYEPDSKLADMDADGVDREVVYTTLGLQLWRLPDTALLQSLFAAYNDWIAAFCAAAPHRLAGVALVLLDDIDAGIAELRRAARLGLRGAMISVYPDESIAYDHPRYEPFWAAAADLDVVLSLHIGTNRVLPPSSPSTSNATSDMALKFLSTPARYVTSANWVQLSLSNMIFAGVFERHPRLKVVSLEHEIAWVPHFLQSMDYTYTQRARRSQWYRFQDDARPSDFFHRNVMISFQEDALGLRLRDVVGVGNLVWDPTIRTRSRRSPQPHDPRPPVRGNPRCGTHTNPRHERDRAVLLMNALVLSPNVEFLFADASPDFNERVAIAAAAGVRAIEFWGWRDKDVDGLERVLRANDVRVTAMVIDPIVSMVCEPDQFVAAIRETAAVAGHLGASTIIVASGARDDTASAAEQCDRAVAALRDALPFAEANGVTLAIEPLNRFDHPVVYISRLHHALSIVDAVGSTALGIVVDFYHASQMNERVADAIGDRVGLIRHMQLAGLPQRDEPSAASAPYPDTVRAFRNGGYDGPISLEYRPKLASATSWNSVRAFLCQELEATAK